MFRQTPPRTVADNQRALIGGFSEAQLTYLRREPGQRRILDDAQSREDLDLTRSIVELARRAQLSGQIDEMNDQEALTRWCLTPLELKLRELLNAPAAPVAGRAARLTFSQWLQGDGGAAAEMFKGFLAQLRERLAQMDQAVAAEAEQARQAALARNQAPAPLTNQELLAKLTKDLMGQAAPQGDDAQVRAILVINGVAYRGRNSSKVDPITRALIVGLTDRTEKWTATGCSEVDALDAFVTAGGFANAAAARAALPAGDCHIVAVEARGPRGGIRSWVKRTPCDQCQQWLATLHITADTKGAYI